MLRKPIVAVVGRPNVGKSTFFNRIAGSRISIVEDTPGVTRDRIYADCEWLTHQFAMIDTGGIEPDSTDIIMSQMRDQAQIAIDTADVIIFVCDGKHSYTTADEDIAQMLRRSKKPVLLVLNKIDQYKKPDHFYDYFDLGLGEPVMISSVNAMGLGDLLDDVVKMFPPHEALEEDDDTIRIALIGKPNVGKSSMVNKIIGENRVIVSDVAGTTRDAIDTPFEYKDQKYVLIDTAGIRRKSKVNESIERYSVLRTITAIERSDVCFILIDAAEGITDQDKKVAGYAHEAGKASIFVINKWDLLEKDNHTFNEFKMRVKEEFPFMMYAPVMFVSALTGQRINQLLEQAKYVSNNHALRISTGVLNDIINEAIALNQVPSDKGKRLKIYYATQVSVKPPTFVLFVNLAELAHFSYVRYLENQIRKNFNYEGTPIVFKVKARGE
ncbi:ribosome biogenesis GTPase Der [Fusibacter bizertensis]|uniref:GTPase Der n=1 Tax=Fusibacter bizertensis TaxID=1488331 RepID=A0ABT6N8H6_9FIRM|nr:ribosome biogenesis GTPase Der [Fusibacter bizertensis]MDH8676708.1 ribosome biogenesis GTPase Der [Fusibacter bizertensis]